MRQIDSQINKMDIKGMVYMELFIKPIALVLVVDIELWWY